MSAFPQRRNYVRGEDHPNAKLREADVLQIRTLRKRRAMPQSTLAALFGVTRQNIARVLSGQTWRHVS